MLTATATVDVTLTATAVGFKIPVYMDRAVFEDTCRWDEEAAARKRHVPYTTTQDRLRAVLDRAWWATAVLGNTGGSVDFPVLRVPYTGRGWIPRRVVLTASLDPTDPGVVITKGAARA